MQQRNFQLPNANEIFRDPNYNEKAKLSPEQMDIQMRALLNNRPDFGASQPPPQQVPKFEEVNNAKLFQVQSLHSDLNLLKATFQSKIAEIEKRLQIMEHPNQASQNPNNMQPFTPPQLTHFQPLQTQMQQMQGGFQMQQPQQQMMQGFQQPQQFQQQPQQGFQQQPQQFQQPPPQQFQQPPQQGFQQQPQMQGGFQPFRASAPPNFR